MTLPMWLCFRIADKNLSEPEVAAGTGLSEARVRQIANSHEATNEECALISAFLGPLEALMFEKYRWTNEETHGESLWNSRIAAMELCFVGGVYKSEFVIQALKKIQREAKRI